MPCIESLPAGFKFYSSKLNFLIAILDEEDFKDIFLAVNRFVDVCFLTCCYLPVLLYGCPTFDNVSAQLLVWILASVFFALHSRTFHAAVA
jgi:hypothetical protein